MSNWRLTGYVPDSEDEDEDVSLTLLSPPSVAVASTPEPVQTKESLVPITKATTNEHDIYSFPEDGPRKEQVFGRRSSRLQVKEVVQYGRAAKRKFASRDARIGEVAKAAHTRSTDGDAEELEKVGFVPTSSICKSVSPRQTLRPTDHVESLTPAQNSRHANHEDPHTPTIAMSDNLEYNLNALIIQSSRDVFMEDAFSRPLIDNAELGMPSRLNSEGIEVLDMIDLADSPLSTQKSVQDDQLRTPLQQASSIATSPLPVPPSNVSLFAVIVPSKPIHTIESVDHSPSTNAPLAEETIFTTPHRLRQRKPIQLNPYLIENERYRQTLKSRGVNPVRIAEQRVEEEKQRNGDDDESQEAEWVTPVVRHVEGQSRAERDEESEGRAISEQDGEVIERLGRLEERRTEGSKSSTKRRKLDKTSSRQTGSSPDAWTAYLASKNAEASRGAQSAPMTSKHAGQQMSPILSSPSRKTPSRRLQLGSLSPLSSPSEKNLETSPARVEASDLSDSSGTRSNRDEVDQDQIEREMRHMQHKIRGVLPASYLKINQKTFPAQSASEANTHRRNRDHSPTDLAIANQPGLARKRIRRRSKTPELIDIVSDGSVSGNEDDGHSSPMAMDLNQDIFSPERDPTPRRVAIDLTGPFEDNRVDMMLSRGRVNRTVPGSRRESSNKAGSKSVSGNPKKRQTRLDLPRVHPSHTNNTKTTKASKRVQQRIGLLDVNTRGSNTGSSPEPPFIRIAKRRVNRRRDKGRAGPSGKTIHLDDKTSTIEAQTILRDWREGTMSVKSPSVRTTDAHNKISPTNVYPIFNFSAESGQGLTKGQISVAPVRQISILTSNKSKTATLSKATSSRTRIPLQNRPLAVISNQGKFLTYQPRQQQKEAQYETVTLDQSRHSRPITRIIDQLAQKQLLRSKIAPQRSRNGNQSCGLRDGQMSRDAQLPLTSLDTSTLSAMDSTISVPPNAIVRPRVRKQPPRKFEIRANPELATYDYQLFNLITEDFSNDVASVDDTSRNFTGLAPASTRYTLDFGIFPLRDGTFFSSLTFIGSGQLAKAMNTKYATFGLNLDQYITCSFLNTGLNWSSYGEEMMSQFEQAFEQLIERMDYREGLDGSPVLVDEGFAIQSYAFFRFVVQYLTDVIVFPDEADLLPFSRRILGAIEKVCHRIMSCNGGLTAIDSEQSVSRFNLQTLVFSVVILLQVKTMLSEFPNMISELSLDRVVDRIGMACISFLCRLGWTQLRTCYVEQQLQSYSSQGISPGTYIVEAWAVVIQVLNKQSTEENIFWRMLNTALQMKSLERNYDISAFESRWRILFYLLPLSSFQSGVVQAGSYSENWMLIKNIIGPIFLVYRENSKRQQLKANSYIRAIFGRCYILITRWRWAKADTIIGTLYDFFARSGLSNLSREEDHGSPSFLQVLNIDTLIQLEDSDTCFHLLLKVIVIGMRSLCTSARSKTLRDLVARLIPNHGRRYPKEEELRSEHLSALRNHHDLLTVLYYASPPPFRPSIDALRFLVDPEKSHLQACRVSLRSWSNILTFQLSSDRSDTYMTPIMSWYHEIMQITLNQHQIAQAQANTEFEEAMKFGEFSISKDGLDRVVRQNRRSLEDILLFGLGLLKQALKRVTNDVTTSMLMVDPVSTANIFAAASVLNDRVVIESLELVCLFITMSRSFVLPVQPEQSEESQNYEMSGMDDFEAEAEKEKAANHFLSALDEPLRRLLSNIFGSDASKSELIFSTAIEAWVQSADFLCVQQVKTWDQFLGDYGRDSWFALRQTEKWRMYTPKFMAKVLEHSYPAYATHRVKFVSFWLTCLIERESMLKFQHEYTSALFNRDSNSAIFLNPPFESTSTGLYKITSTQFRERRLSLISTILANMRESQEAAHQHSVYDGTLLKREYAEMLQTMMTAMRQNYEELQAFTENRLHRNASSAYVEFVHHVVEYLQQHTIDIVPVDKFFTDSSSFPLPATDPAYVAGRLKNYGMKLSSSRVYKQLSSFFQSLCERAAVDRQQVYLISQLSAAFAMEFEAGDMSKPTLRSFCMHSLFPAYLQNVFMNVAAWTLAMPVLDVVEAELTILPELVDSKCKKSSEIALSMIATILDSLRTAADFWVDNCHFFANSSTTQQLLCRIFRIASLCLPLLDSLSCDRSSASGEHGYTCTEYLLELVHYINLTLRKKEPLPPRFWSPGFQHPFSAARADFTKDITNTLRKDWVMIGEELMIVRGNTRRGVDYKGLLVNMQNEDQIELTYTIRVLIETAARSDRLAAVVWRINFEIWQMQNAPVFAQRMKVRKDALQLQEKRALGGIAVQNDEDEVCWSDDD